MKAQTRASHLYGPGRTSLIESLRLRDKLTKSTWLQDGEYNFTRKNLEPGSWQTSANADFAGYKLEKSNQVPAMSNLKHNFTLNNDNERNVPIQIYQQSETKDIFIRKEPARTSFSVADRTVNWPDMAPQYTSAQTIGQSEYASTFRNQEHSSTAPVFPRVNTFKVKLPLDPARCNAQRNSRIYFGSDNGNSHVSEQQRAFGRVTSQADMTSKMAFVNQAFEEYKERKETANKSNVFRLGDYDNITGIMMDSSVRDFGPRTRTPGLVSSQVQRSREISGDTDNVSTPEVVNLLTDFARKETVPLVYKDAKESKDYQTSAHFKFGFDRHQKTSIYGTDFPLGAMANRTVPRPRPTPDARKIFPTDPKYTKVTTNVQRTDFMPPPPQMKSTDLEKILEKYSGNNVALSYDKTRYVQDRQKSITHADYSGPPSDTRPVTPQLERRHPYPFLHTDPALPYPGLPSQSETSNTFAGTLSEGNYALNQRLGRDEICRELDRDTKATHFVLGFEPSDFISVNSLAYSENRTSSRVADKMAVKSKMAPFQHLKHSENIQDVCVPQSHTTSKTRTGPNHIPDMSGKDTSFYTSVMKNDFMGGQLLNSEQQRAVEKCNKLVSKPISTSHLFHMDNSGWNNYVSTTMSDFITPENVDEETYEK